MRERVGLASENDFAATEQGSTDFLEGEETRRVLVDARRVTRT